MSITVVYSTVRETMTRKVRVEIMEGVPPDATVRHYDELADPVKERLPSLVEGDDMVGQGVADDLTVGEYIKYTDYYRVETDEND